MEEKNGGVLSELEMEREAGSGRIWNSTRVTNTETSSSSLSLWTNFMIIVSWGSRGDFSALFSSHVFSSSPYFVRVG